jgi:phage terminase large subunit GpA-like protein
MSPLAATFVLIARLWAPPPKLTVSQWADSKRKLSSESAAQAGQWHTRPYQREPMDAFTDPSIHTIVLMVARQTLKTEVLNNCLGYIIDQDPGPTMVVQFRDTDCKKFSKIRLAPMLRDTPCLRGKISEDKGRSGGNTFEYKAFPGGHLSIVASGSPGNLMALPIRYVLCDEIDKYPVSAGSAGDPISLAQGRQEEFWNRKTVLACTPTDQGRSRIEAAFNDSDKREYELCCPQCGEFQIPNWRTQVKFNSGAPTRREQTESAYYECANPDCKAEWDDVDRWKASANGRFRATAPFNGIAGFRVSGLCRLGTKLSAMVEEFLTKKGAQETLKTFINEQLAELWTEPGEVLEWRTLLNRREEYPVGTVPKGGLFLTAGVDVQREDGGRLEVEVVAWGENRESWSVDYRILHGNPAEKAVWDQLESLLRDTWPNESGAEMAIERMFVDSGDGTVTPYVYEWVRTQPRPRVWAIKGDKRSDLPVGMPKAVELTTGGKKLKYGVLFKIVNSDYFKAGFYADLKKRAPTDEERNANGMGYPQGYCHFPIATEYGDEHFKQICSEQLITHRDVRGRQKTEWQQTRPRNEGLDTRVYAAAAAWDFGAHRFQQRHWDMLRAKVKDLAPAPAETEPGQAAAVVTAPVPQQQQRRVIRSRFMN